MKSNINRLIIIALLSAITYSLSAQKNISYADVITSDDLESYISFLASPLLKGRMNGEPELEVAQQYIVSQAKLMKLIKVLFSISITALAEGSILCSFLHEVIITSL
jgi:hypothetical protein